MIYSNLGILNFGNTQLREYWTLGILDFGNTQLLEYSTFGILSFGNTQLLKYSTLGILYLYTMMDGKGMKVIMSCETFVKKLIETFDKKDMSK